MKQILKITGIALLAIFTVANAGALAYQFKKAPVNSSSKQYLAPKPTLGITNTKQHRIISGQEGEKIGEGDYKTDVLDHSRIEQTETASLVLASQKSVGANFVLASHKGTKYDQDKIADGWEVKTISSDPLWAPGACSSKPTLLLKGRYIFIDDGKTRPTDAYNSYLVFDMQAGKYSYFGGDNFTSTQAKDEQIMLATDENDGLVLYIDKADDKGPLAHSSSFKHSASFDNGYITRRVIDPATMHYTDYRIVYNLPKDVDVGNTYYYASMYNGNNNDGATLSLMPEGSTDPLTGAVVNNVINIKRNNAAQVPVYDTDKLQDSELEKQLNNPLAKALPDFLTGTFADTAHYATRFRVSELGKHNNTTFVLVSSRSSSDETPAIITSDNQVLPLTTKTLFNADSYVALGVF